MNSDLKILIQAQFDTSQKAIDDLNKQIKQLEAKLNKINVNIDPKFVKSLSNNLNDVTNKINKVTQKQNELNKAFEVQNKASGVARYSDLQKRVEEIKNSAKEVSKITVDTKKDINDLEKATISYKDALGRLVQERYKLIETDKKISDGNTTKTIKEWELESQKVVDNLEQQRKRLANLGTQITNVNPALFDFGKQDELKQFMQQFHDGEIKITRFKESLQNGKNRVVEFNVQVQKGKKDVEEYKYYFDELTNAIYKNSAALKNNSNNQLGLAEQLSIAVERTVVWATAMTGFYGSIRAIESMLQEILLVDQAMTELKRVMDATPEQYNEMLQQSIQLSQDLGNNVHDVLKSLNEAARSFGDLSQQELLAVTKTATIAANVSDLSADEAMQDLIGTMNAFNIAAEDSIQIVDKMNEVDNNYSISTKQIADAMSKASSTAKTFGVSIDELIGHVTAIGEVTMESGSVIGKCVAA